MVKVQDFDLPLPGMNARNEVRLQQGDIAMPEHRAQHDHQTPSFNTAHVVPRHNIYLNTDK